MEHILFQYQSPRSSEIASRLFIDLKQYDMRFLKDCEQIFEINSKMERHGGRLLREYMEITISEIVALYSMNPLTLMGTLNIGPDVRQYPELQSYSQEVQDKFAHAYKSFATRVCSLLVDYLAEYQNKAIDMGYSDVQCSVARYVPGSLLLNMRGISPFPNRR